MIDAFVKIWDEHWKELEDLYRKEIPSTYEDVVEAVVKLLSKYSKETYGKINYKNIHQIDDGDYQGTLLFVIPEDFYQPHDYWYVKVFYGSCSVCDTMESIIDTEGTDKEAAIRELMTLSLHVVQGLKEMK